MSTASPPSPAQADLFWDGYRPPDGCYDEMVTPDGRLRPHWQGLAQAVGTLGRDELARRWQQAQRMIYDNGVTFNAVDEAGDSSRPWELDAVPLVVATDEWRTLEAGLAQRARLLDLALQDLFGPQRLLREKVLPPDLLYATPDFFRAYHSLPAAEGRWLHLYAADLARSREGRWWVMSDRTRAPSGLGYVLENRIVTSRMLPGVFRQCRVQRLAPFFIAMRETLQRLAPRSRENPRIVLLSKGPQSYRYFEDAYLARYLGYTLVEGGDLAVRNERVNLKTLGGLLPVEVVLRRMGDEDCDPVELHRDSTSGIAGLLEVVRAGNVVMANGLGSRLVQAPAFKAFWPGVCRFLLGEELQLPSVATWWCGQARELAWVLEHLDALVIRPSFRVDRTAPVVPSELTGGARAELIAALKARPADYVAEEQVHRSTAPVWTDDGLQSWHVALRSFLVATQDGYHALPGGLVRASPDHHLLERSMTSGERSQDCWVLADGPIADVSLLQPAGQPIALRRSGAELPSRVADNLFWLGRYVERAEGAARLLRCVLTRIASESAESPELPTLFRALAAMGQLEPGFVLDGLKQPLPNIERALPEAVFDRQEQRSLRTTVDQMTRLASAVRDRISTDAWRIVHRIDEEATRPGQSRDALDAGDVLAVLNNVITGLSALSGLSGESMTRTQGWRFLELGRRIERASHTTSLLQATLVTPQETEPAVLEAVLETADSIMTYRSRYLSSVQPAPVLDLLLTDETNPRSIGYQLAAVGDHVSRLPRDEQNPLRSPDERTALSLLNTVRLADVDDLSHAGSDGVRKQLDRLLARLTEQLPKLSDAISHRYLIHAGIPRQFTGTNA